MVCALALGAGALVVAATGADGAAAFLHAQQQAFHRTLTDTLRAVRDGGAGAGWALAAMSFLYGLFHAAGPGHGKAVIAAYAGTQDLALRQVVGLSAASAVLQGVSAVAIVGGLVALSGLSGRDAQAAASTFERLSFVVLIVAGLALSIRALAGLRGDPKRACAQCGHTHAPEPGALAPGAGWRGRLAVTVSVGLRPCTGAVLVLVVAHILELWWHGVAAVLAMALGVSIAVSGLGALALCFRKAAIAVADIGDSRRARQVNAILAATGGLTLAVIGLTLLSQAGQTRHALF